MRCSRAVQFVLSAVEQSETQEDCLRTVLACHELIIIVD